MESKVTNLSFNPSQLERVNFVFGSPEIDKVYSIKIFDTVEIDEINSKSFKIIYSRSTKEKSPFYISVSYSVIAIFDQVGVDFYAGDLERIKNFAETNKIDICNKIHLPSKASTLISNIVRDTGTPVVTPPFVTIEQN